MADTETPPPADDAPAAGETEFFAMMDKWADARAARIAEANKPEPEEPERTKQDGPKSFLSQFLNFE